MKFAIDRNGDIVLIEEKEDIEVKQKIKFIGVEELYADYIYRGEYNGSKDEFNSRYKG